MNNTLFVLTQKDTIVRRLPVPICVKSVFDEGHTVSEDSPVGLSQPVASYNRPELSMGVLTGLASRIATQSQFV